MKKFSKLLSIVLVLMLTLSLAACGSEKAVEDKLAATPESTGGFKEIESSDESGYPKAEDLPKHKIGVLYWGYTDLLGSQIKKNLDYLGKEFNCEMVYADGGMAIEGYVTATENLIQNGAEGIVSIFALPGMIEACEKAGVYLVQGLNETTDPDTLTLMKNSKYFVGMFTENDYECGYTMVEDLYNKGCRNITYMSPTPGMAANHDNRVRGIEDALKDFPDMKLLSNYRGDAQVEALQNFAAVYPEMDGLIVTGGTQGGTESIYQTIQSEGLSGKVKFATIDIGEGTAERLESGDLAWIAGGQYPTTGIAFSALYNALAGTPVIDDCTKTVYRPFMSIQSAEEFEQYLKYVDGDIPPYSGDEIKALIKKFNPDASLDLYEQYGKAYGIKDVVERHKDLF